MDDAEVKLFLSKQEIRTIIEYVGVSDHEVLDRLDGMFDFLVKILPEAAPPAEGA